MEFIVNEVITQPYTIEADNVDEALKARERGEGTPLPNRNIQRSAALRPQPAQPQVRSPSKS